MKSKAQHRRKLEREIRKLIQSGYSSEEIAKDLNFRGITTTLGNKWNARDINGFCTQARRRGLKGFRRKGSNKRRSSEKKKSSSSSEGAELEFLYFAMKLRDTIDSFNASSEIKNRLIKALKTEISKSVRKINEN